MALYYGFAVVQSQLFYACFPKLRKSGRLGCIAVRKDKYRKIIYRCNGKYSKGKQTCTTPHLTEEQIKEIFLKALNTLVEEKEETIENLNELINTICFTDTLISEQNKVKNEMDIITDNLSNIIKENASIAQNQKEYFKRDLYSEKINRYKELLELIQDKDDKRTILLNFIHSLSKLTEKQTEFRSELWGGLVDHITINKDESKTVVFRGEISITVK